MKGWDVLDVLDVLGDGGLDAARGRFDGVCRGARAAPAAAPDFDGAEFGACCGRGRCGVWRCAEDENVPESEWGLPTGGGRVLPSAGGEPSGACVPSANCIVRDGVWGIGIDTWDGVGSGPGAWYLARCL